MNKLFFDIETIPVDEEKHPILKELYDRSLDDGKKVGTFEEYIAQTSFDGAFGRIVCLGWVFNEEKTESISGSESEIIKKFWEIAEKADLFIGYNLLDFDLRFIYQRSVILGIKPSKEINLRYYSNSPVYDLMWEWVKWKKPTTKLHNLAKAMGIPSSKDGEIEGKDVAKAYMDGRIKEICQYCEKDVEVTRAIYKKLTFS